MQRFDGSEIIWTFKNVGTTRTATGKIDGKVVATITNLKKGTTASDLTVDGDVITVSKNALATTAVNLNRVMLKGNYTLALADDVTKSELTKAAGWKVSGTSATYQTASRTKGFILAGDGKSISWHAGAVSKNLTTVTGLKEGVTADDLKLNGTNVILSPNALGTTPVKINNNYNLALATDVKKSTTTAARWNISGTTATYTTAKVTEGYVLAANKKTVTYKPKSGGEVLATLTGLKSETLPKYISLNAKNKTITLSKNALNPNSTVSLEGDYSLALASDVTKAKVTAAHWEINGTTARYVAAKTVGGYKLSSDKKSISHLATGGGNVLATLKGLKKGVTAKDLSISGNVITLSKNALGTSTVTLTGEYSLALADGISAPKTNDAKFVVNGTTAKYISAKTTAGYTVADDKKSVVYSPVTGGKVLATIDNLKPGTTADKFSIKDKKILLAAGITGAKGSTVNGKNYAFDLTTVGKLTNVGSDASLLGSGGNDTLIGGKGADYISGGNVENSYDYLSGGAGNDTVIGGYGYHTLLGGDGNDYVGIVKYRYPDGTYPDSIEKAGNSYLNGGNGNDTLQAAYGNDTLIGGDGNDILYSNVGKNTLNGGTGNDSIYGTGTLLGGAGKDTLFSSFKTDDYLAGGADNDTLITYYGNNTLLGGAGNDWIQGGPGDDTIYGGDGNDMIFTGSGNDYVDGGKGDDNLISGYGRKILLGGDGNDHCNGIDHSSIDGGAGNDWLTGSESTLTGGTGNDTLDGYVITVTGGKGNDVFCIGCAFGPTDHIDVGTQVVMDYTAGEDKILVSSTFLDSTETEVSGNDVILHVNWKDDDGNTSTGDLKIKNAKGKAITFINDDGKTIATKTFTASAASSSAALLAENNFATSGNLSSIVKNNFSSLGEIPAQNFDSLTQENLITYTDK